MAPQIQLTISPYRVRPKTQGSWATPLTSLVQQLGFNFSIWTWLLAGACLQGLVVLLVGDLRYALLPPFLFGAFRLTENLLVVYNVLPNPYMKDAFLGRRTALVPDSDGAIHPESREKVTIMLLGAKCNHPFGLLAPEFYKTFQWVVKMNEKFDSTDKNVVPNGFLGQLCWSRRDERGAIEYSFISYWRSVECLHDFAHGPLHREAWNWWEKTLKQHDYIGISHEIFESPPGHWENMYTNFQPSGMGATAHLVKHGSTSTSGGDNPLAEKGAELQEGVLGEEWIIPLVDARRGPLSKSSTRLGWEGGIKYDADRPYKETYA